MTTIVGNALYLPFRDRAFDGIVTSPCYGNRMADHHDARDDSKRNTYTHSARHPAKFSDEVLNIIRKMLYEDIEDAPFVTILDPFAGVGRVHELMADTYGIEIEPAWARGEIRDTTKPLHPQNSGQMQWGDLYRAFHRWAWAEATRVARQFFILNISDHIRRGQRQGVTTWHVAELVKLGWRPARWEKVSTPRLRFGENHRARVDHEWVVLLVRG